jgi:dTDP-4-amino-4,6-dideoxygalactose transaminase
MTIDMVELEQTIKDPDCVVIEDGCHALGSHYPSGQKVGSCAYSQMTIFSFHPAKMITTGEGGMVTTNDLDLYKRLRLFRNNGIERDPHHLGHIQKPWEYDVQELSSNYNFTDFQAALGSSQLSRINALIDKRHHLVATYRRLLRDKPHIHQLSGLCDNHTAFHLFTIHVDFKACGTTRDAVMQRLHARQIGSQLHYIPVYRHQAFKRRCGDISSLFPVMEKHYQQALSLPLYPELTDADIARVVNELCLALGKQ